MENKKMVQALKDTANEVGGKVYNHYSGRCMFGKTCMGIVCDDLNDCLRVAGKNGLPRAKTDNMGLQYIVYWESVVCEDDDEDDDEVD